MKQKLKDLFDYLLFVLFFILILPILILSGAIARPIRYYQYTINTVKNKKVKEYYY